MGAQVEQESGLNGIKVTPLLSARWNELSEEEKSPFNAQANKEMAVWKKKMVAYKKTASYKEFQAAKKSKKFAKKPKDKNAPKRPSSAFFCFSSDVREDVKAELGADATIGNVGKELGNLWGMMSEEDKEIYFAKSAQLIAKFQEIRSLPRTAYCLETSKEGRHEGPQS